MNSIYQKFQQPPRYFGYLALLIWATIYIFILRRDAYNLDEGAAQSLLLSWSVIDQIASSVVTFGAPDLRFLLYFPVGLLWTGNIVAAKILTIALFAFTAWLFFSWESQKGNSENALLATCLLIISPLALNQIDTLSCGTYLLASFAVGSQLDNAYRLSPRAFGGGYFALLFVCSLSVSLHPAGLALPISLAWSWYKHPINAKLQKSFYYGIGITTLATLIIRSGWGSFHWFQNPIASLSTIAMGPMISEDLSSSRLVTGIVISLLLLLTIKAQFKHIRTDILGRCLTLGLIIGLVIGDQSWALIALAATLFFGLAMILQMQKLNGGFLHQRGMVLLLIMITATIFMYADKMHYMTRIKGTLPTQDQLIKILSDEINTTRINIGTDNEDDYTPRIASQWPSRTMIACKCDTLPLPPATEDPRQQINMLFGLSYLLFDPTINENATLVHNLSQISGQVLETIALQQSGVLLRINHPGNISEEKSSSTNQENQP